MKIGPLWIGWSRIDEIDRFNIGLDPCPAGWEIFGIEWKGNGFAFLARPRKGETQ